MSAENFPFGLRPSYHPSGTIRPTAGTIATTYATNIFQFAPVALAADGTLTAAAAGARAVGSFQGCEFTSVGRRFYLNYWPENTAATEIVAYFTEDPAIVYQVQANATLAITNVGSQLDWTANGDANGSLGTGLSTVGADVATITAVGSAGLRILGLAPYIDNAWGDAFPVIEVQISEHQFVADLVAF
jgi:hypothetical protein